MNHASLFSGFGGFDLAAEWMGWNNVFHCEWMPFPRQVLKYHFPNSITYEDITKTDFTIHRGTIDVLTGGFPCQPYSVAGKRLGKEDERHLWPEMLRAILEIEPRFVVGENVRGLISWNGGMVFDEVQADLENAGYEVIPFVIPACAVNAPHRRDRVWFVAKNTKCNGRLFGELGEETTSDGEQRHACTGSGDGVCLSTGIASNANHTRGGSRLGEIQGKNGEIPKRNNDAESCDTSDERNFANDNSFRLEGGVRPKGGEREVSTLKSFTFHALPLRGSWQSFPTQPPICGGDDGLPTELDGITFSKWRNESIKGYGNAVVPQVVYQIFKAIEASKTV